MTNKHWFWRHMPGAIAGLWLAFGLFVAVQGCAAMKPVTRTVIDIAKELCDADIICQQRVIAEHNAAMSRMAAGRAAACSADAGE